MNKLTNKNKRIRRHKKVRQQIENVVVKPRLCVFRSNKHIYAQVIDDAHQVTLVQASDRDKELETKNKTKTEVAKEVGKILATRALKKKIKKVSFDRGGFMYKGRVKALAEGGREGGLTF